MIESWENHAEEKKNIKIQHVKQFTLLLQRSRRGRCRDGLLSSAEQDCVVYSTVRKRIQSAPSQHRAGTTQEQ